LLGNAHESVRENSQLDWIKFFADGSLACRADLNLQVATGRHFGYAARLHENCAQPVDNNGWAVDVVTLSQVLQQQDRSFVRTTLKIHPCRLNNLLTIKKRIGQNEFKKPSLLAVLCQRTQSEALAEG
jgi:hypothetical protein